MNVANMEQAQWQNGRQASSRAIPRLTQSRAALHGFVMSPVILGCVVCAAFLHASWNAVLRGGRDRLWSMSLMMIAIGAASGVALLTVPWVRPASWPYLTTSALIHVGYNLALVRTYRTGELGQSYPISRGSSPVLVSVGALLLAHEHLALLSVAGIGLVSAGILSFAIQGRRLGTEYLPAALTTGVLIAAYTVADGAGVRLSGSVLGYTASMFLLWSLLWAPLAFLLQHRPPKYSLTQTTMALAGGLVSIVAYTVVIWAMKYGPMATVSALRETSVVWAALIGRVFLKERLTRSRLGACVVIAVGAACLS